MGYAFISYSSKNKSEADAVRALFARNDIDTWMAPYDIPAGAEYAEVLYDALIGCACLVLILTDPSQNSSWVKKEVNIAISNGKTVIPIMLDDIELNSAMKLYLNDQQIVSVRVINDNSQDMRRVVRSVRTYTCGCEPVAEKRTESVNADCLREQVLEDPWECYRQGYAYELGEGVPQDKAKAAWWYERGAVQDNSWCCHRMGEFHLFGIAMPRDPKKAVYWYRRGGELGDPSCCRRMAECYQKGMGVKADWAQAAYWKSKAGN